MGDRQLRLTARQATAVARIAGLTVVNAMVFQEMLAQDEARVEPLRKTLDAPDATSAFANHWRFILDEIDYVPIFRLAREISLSLSPGPSDGSG